MSSNLKTSASPNIPSLCAITAEFTAISTTFFYTKIFFGQRFQIN